MVPPGGMCVSDASVPADRPRRCRELVSCIHKSLASLTPMNCQREWVGKKLR